MAKKYISLEEARIAIGKPKVTPGGIIFDALKKACQEEVRNLPAVDVVERPRWIPVEERVPECEQEVLICTEKKILGQNAYLDTIVTPAIYEDGTMRENDSIWCWEDIDYAGWDEEEDCGIIPEGWWENRHFNPDDVYNNPVDRKVVAWMPLPEPPKEET